MKKQFTLLAAATALSLGLTACNKGGASGIFDYVPNDAVAVVTVNADHFRNSDLGKTILKDIVSPLTAAEDYKMIQTKFGVDPVKDLKQLVIFAGPNIMEKESEACIIADIPLKADNVVKTIEEFGMKPEVSDVAGTKVYKVDGASIAFVNNYTIACEPSLIESALKAKSNGLAIEKDHEVLKDSTDKIVMVSGKINDKLAPMLGEVAPIEQAKDLKNVALSLKSNGKDLGIAVQAGFSKADSATSLKAMADKEVMPQLPALAQMAGLSFDAKDLTIDAKGNQLVVNVNLKEAVINQGLKMVEGLVGMGGEEEPINQPAKDGMMIEAPLVPDVPPIVPNNDPVVPAPAAPVPGAGAVDPNAGAVIPGAGAVDPNAGAVIPGAGEAPAAPAAADPNAGLSEAEKHANLKLAIAMAADADLTKEAAAKPANFDNLFNYVPGSADTVVALNFEAVRTSIFWPVVDKIIDGFISDDYLNLVKKLGVDPAKSLKTFAFFAGDKFGGDDDDICLLTEMPISRDGLFNLIASSDMPEVSVGNVNGVTTYTVKDAIYANVNGVQMLCGKETFAKALGAKETGLAHEKAHKAALKDANQKLIAVSAKMTNSIQDMLKGEDLPVKVDEIQKLTLTLGEANNQIQVTSTIKFETPELATKSANEWKEQVKAALADPSVAAMGINPEVVNIAAAKSTVAVIANLPSNTVKQALALAEAFLNAGASDN